MSASQPPGPGATPPASRAPAPDLARGAMLLLIAVANVHYYLYDRPLGLRGYPADLQGVDRVLAAVQTTVVDGRAYPLFGILLGYGVVQMGRRQATAGRGLPAARTTVRRRGAALVVIGLVHGVALWPGEIVGAYGLLLLVMAGLLLAGTSVSLLTTAAVGIAVGTLFGLAVAPPAELTAPRPSLAVADPVTALAARAGDWVANGLLAQAVGVFGAVALGAWAARYGWLDEPARHRRLLVRVAAGGLVLAVLGGVPLGLATGGYWPGATGAAVALAGGVHALSGFAGGAGFAALAGLLATRRDGPGLRVLRAGGQWSLSVFVGQSAVFALLLPAWTLGLGATLPLWQASLLAVATWAMLLLLAAVGARAGRRGPAEALLRRMTHGRAAGTPANSRPRRR